MQTSRAAIIKQVDYVSIETGILNDRRLQLTDAKHSALTLSHLNKLQSVNQSNTVHSNVLYCCSSYVGGVGGVMVSNAVNHSYVLGLAASWADSNIKPTRQGVPGLKYKKAGTFRGQTS